MKLHSYCLKKIITHIFLIASSGPPFTINPGNSNVCLTYIDRVGFIESYSRYTSVVGFFVTIVADLYWARKESYIIDNFEFTTIVNAVASFQALSVTDSC